MKKKSIVSIIIIFCAFFGIYNFLSINGIVVNSFLSSADKSVIKIGDTGYSNFISAFEAAKDGDILTLEEDIEVTDYSEVPASKHLTLDLKGNTIVIATEKSTRRAFPVKGKGSFTIKNGKVTAKDVDGDGYTSGFMDSQDSNINMENLEVYNLKAYLSGAVISIDARNDVDIEIKNCNFHDNISNENGGH